MGQLIQLENFARLKPYAGMFAEGLAITVLLALFTVLIGFILALLLALMRMSNFRPFRALGLNRDGHLRDGGFLLTLSKFNPLSFIPTAYVEVICSTPMMVQILIIYLGVFSVIQLPKFSIFGFIESQRFIPGVVALGMNSGAYLCEIIQECADLGFDEILLTDCGFPTQGDLDSLRAVEEKEETLETFCRQLQGALADTPVTLSVMGQRDSVTADPVSGQTTALLATFGRVWTQAEDQEALAAFDPVVLPAVS